MGDDVAFAFAFAAAASAAAVLVAVAVGLVSCSHPSPAAPPQSVNETAKRGIAATSAVSRAAIYVCVCVAVGQVLLLQLRPVTGATSSSPAGNIPAHSASLRPASSHACLSNTLADSYDLRRLRMHLLLPLLLLRRSVAKSICIFASLCLTVTAPLRTFHLLQAARF